MDHGDTGGGPSIFSARIMAAFVTAFGVGGVVGRYYNLSHPGGVGSGGGLRESSCPASSTSSRRCSIRSRPRATCGCRAWSAGPPRCPWPFRQAASARCRVTFGGERSEHLARSADGKAMARGAARWSITGLRGDSVVVAPAGLAGAGRYPMRSAGHRMFGDRGRAVRFCSACSGSLRRMALFARNYIKVPPSMVAIFYGRKHTLIGRKGQPFHGRVPRGARRRGAAACRCWSRSSTCRSTSSRFP